MVPLVGTIAAGDDDLLAHSHLAVGFALGADFVMLGRYFARFEESPAPHTMRLARHRANAGDQRAQHRSGHTAAHTQLMHSP